MRRRERSASSRPPRSPRRVEPPSAPPAHLGDSARTDHSARPCSAVVSQPPSPKPSTSRCEPAPSPLVLLLLLISLTLAAPADRSVHVPLQRRQARRRLPALRAHLHAGRPPVDRGHADRQRGRAASSRRAPRRPRRCRGCTVRPALLYFLVLLLQHTLTRVRCSQDGPGPWLASSRHELAVVHHPLRAHPPRHPLLQPSTLLSSRPRRRLRLPPSLETAAKACGPTSSCFGRPLQPPLASCRARAALL